MDKEEFIKLEIEDQVKFINDKTMTGLTVSKVASESNISESVIRRIMKKNKYKFDRVNKIYSLDEITGVIPKKELKINNEVIKVEEKKGYIFSDKEIQQIKELLKAKEELLHLIEITTINDDISILDMDRSNRKKATFNMNIGLLNELEKYNDNPNISKSDIVNIAIKEYLKRKSE
jgi:transcriptional regulator with XRE-family HTH domain